VGRLRAAGLVVTRRSGRETFCRLLAEAFDTFTKRQAEILGLAVPVEDGTNRGRAIS
jgi:hypothetical protein